MADYRPMKPRKAWNRFTATPEELAELKAQGLSDNEVATLYGVCPSTVVKHRHAQGIPGGWIRRIDEAWLREGKAAGKTDAELAAEAGVAPSTIFRRRQEWGIEDRAKPGRKKK